jgi:hypothetical protein
MLRKLKKIEVGQRFQSIGAITGVPTSVYEVQSLFRSRIDQVEYARLAVVDDPTAIKSIAISALLNPAQFSAIL